MTRAASPSTNPPTRSQRARWRAPQTPQRRRRAEIRQAYRPAGTVLPGIHHRPERDPSGNPCRLHAQISRLALYKVSQGSSGSHACSRATGRTDQRTEVDSDFVLRRLLEEVNADARDLYAPDGTLLPVPQWPEVWRRGLVTHHPHHPALRTRRPARRGDRRADRRGAGGPRAPAGASRQAHPSQRLRRTRDCRHGHAPCRSCSSRLAAT